MANTQQPREPAQEPIVMDLGTALRTLNGTAGLRMPAETDLANLLGRKRQVQQDWLKTWIDGQNLRKKHSAADTAAIQAIGMLLDPAVIEHAIEREQEWRNLPENKGKTIAPANYRVPQGLRDALLKYKEQISKTDRAVHDNRYAKLQADEKEPQALAANERYSDIEAKGSQATTTEADKLQAYRRVTEETRNIGAQADENAAKALAANESYSDIARKLANGEKLSTVEADKLQTYQRGVQSLRKETAEADMTEDQRDIVKAIKPSIMAAVQPGAAGVQGVLNGSRTLLNSVLSS